MIELMTPEEYAASLERLGISYADLAAFLGASSRRTTHRWLSELPPPNAVSRVLQCLALLDDWLPLGRDGETILDRVEREILRRHHLKREGPPIKTTTVIRRSAGGNASGRIDSETYVDIRDYLEDLEAQVKLVRAIGRRK